MLVQTPVQTPVQILVQTPAQTLVQTLVSGVPHLELFCWGEAELLQQD